jgi:hypothetical protein
MHTVPGFANVCSRGYVYSVAKQVPSADQHVADVNPDAEADAAIRCETCVRLGQSSLGLYRALHSVNCAS